MLSPYRVLDLTNEGGLLCGQLLADLGAEVLQVEPPGGSSARRVGPWWKDEPGCEHSLFWWSYARNKRSVVVDLETEEGRACLRGLAAGADFFVESEPPGRLAALGLGYRDLAQLNPSLVVVSITPFGQTGPKAHWAASDLTLMAASGCAYLSGDADRPPVRCRVPQAHAHAGADAAVGALIAHFARRRTGRGQHVDVSAQQSATLGTQFRILDAPLEQTPARRVSGGVRVGRAFLPSRYRLVDGWAILGPGYLPSTGHFMKRLLGWALEEGLGSRELVDEDWSSFGLRLVRDQIPPEAYAPVDAALSALFARKTTSQVMEAAVGRRLLVAPLLEMDQVVDSPQLAARHFGLEIERPEVGKVVHPGPWARFAASPLRMERPAPRLDEHGDALRAEPPRTPVFAQAGPPSTRPGCPIEAPLEGVRILDLFWVLAGPGATRMLADYGATVVRVESGDRLDTLRAIPPYHYSNPHAECAGAFQSANANKLGIQIDLANEASREVLHDLVGWADVVTESFAPGVIDDLGLGYEALRVVKPDLVMISSCLMGQTGPWRSFTGFGNLAATVTGFQQLSSWPDRPPSGPFGAYTDFIALRYNALAILAALEHRARTGEGQYIDQAQAEAALHFLAPAFLDYTVNGRVQGAAGNDDTELFPHAMFPARGEDRWVALACRHEDDREALCRSIGREDLVGRPDARGELLEAVAQWTRGREAGEVVRVLQQRGVPAHEALDTPGLHACEQLHARGHFVEIAHDIFPSTTVESSRLRLSGAEARRPERALSIGRDTRHVLEAVLGYAPEKIAALEQSGALGPVAA